MTYARRICYGLFGIFPIEIYEHIVDCIHSDDAGTDGVRNMQKALCSCALTCQAWLPRNRFLLYQSITVNSSGDHAHNQDVMRRLAGTMNSSAHLTDLIRHLTVCPITSFSKPGVASVLPLLLVNTLPKLHTLTIHESTLIVNPAFCHSVAKFSALATLNLTLIVFANISAFRRLLAALQSLRYLKLENVSWQTVGIWRQTASQYTRQMPRVRKLSMVGGQVCTFYRRVLYHASI